MRASLPGGNSEREPPDPIPNSEVKTLCADGSVGSPHVRVGHRQALDLKAAAPKCCGFFILRLSSLTVVNFDQYVAIGFLHRGLERLPVAGSRMCQLHQQTSNCVAFKATGLFGRFLKA